MFAASAWPLALVPLGVAVGAIVSGALVARTSSKELAVQRQLQSTQSFLELIAIAHSRPRDGREKAGVSEQVAAVHLVSEFGRQHNWLRTAATEGLRSMYSWMSSSDAVLRNAVDTALIPLDASPPDHSTLTAPAT